MRKSKRKRRTTCNKLSRAGKALAEMQECLRKGLLTDEGKVIYESLSRWYLRNHELTFKQIEMAKSIIEMAGKKSN